MNEAEKQVLIQNMKDAACSDRAISDVICLIDSDRKDEGIRALRMQRCILMEKLHEQQQKVDCLDYLLYQLQGGK